MRILHHLVLLWVVSAWSVIAAESKLVAELQPFQPLLKTWQGELAQPGRAPKVDVSRWERALNGQAIRITHSIERGEYGGETILFWDKTKQSLVYYYFTTAGFYTHGTMRVENHGQQFVAEEDVANNAQGITKVRSKTQLADGKMSVSSEYLKNGVWELGHNAVYTPIADQQPEFR